MTESSKKRPSKSLNNSISSTPLKPSAKMVKVSDESDVSISKLFELVSDMNKKLDKLDCIEIHLSRVDLGHCGSKGIRFICAWEQR